MSTACITHNENRMPSVVSWKAGGVQQSSKLPDHEPAFECGGQPEVLIVESDQRIADTIHRALLKSDHHVVSVCHPRQALEAATLHDFDIAIIDTSLPESPGIELMQRLQRLLSNVKLLLISHDPTGPSLREALRLGACNLVHLPCPTHVVVSVVKHAFERHNSAKARLPRSAK